MTRRIEIATAKFVLISSYEKLSAIIDKILLFPSGPFLFLFRDSLKQDQNLSTIGLERLLKKGVSRDISRKLFSYR